MSPEAQTIIGRARGWRQVQYGMLGAALFSLFLSAVSDNPYTSEAYGVGTVLLVGGAFAANAHYDALLRDAAATYNRDLRAAFRPTFGWTWGF